MLCFKEGANTRTFRTEFGYTEYVFCIQYFLLNGCFIMLLLILLLLFQKERIEKERATTIHHSNFQSLTYKKFKVKKDQIQKF